MKTVKRFSLDDSLLQNDRHPSFRSTGLDSPLSPTDSVGSVFFSSEAENGVDEKRGGRHASTPLQTLSNETELIDSKKKLPITRSKVGESPFVTTDTKNEPKLERKKAWQTQFSKANIHYHKLFKEVPDDEPLKQSFTCALQKEMLYQGKLYVSENWIAFHSKVFGKDTKIAIPVLSVTLIKKTKTALLVPNALVITTDTERYMFVSLLSRDATYKLIKSVCVHLENESVGNSPNPSSPDSSFRAERPNTLPLDFNVDFSELDGMVKHRRQEMEEFSSTSSQTPESENSQEFPLETPNLLEATKPEVSIAQADIFPRSHEGKMRKSFRNDRNRPFAIFHQVTSSPFLSMNMLLIFYAVLVFVLFLSTLYMRSKILTLEQQLATLGSFMASHRMDQSAHRLGPLLHTDADNIYNELTANLATLDQIQKNLQRLLEDAD
ncbi:GRAM domain-containing protein 2B isoform X2 [Rhinatrema bivittatum]|uniref:GRAM domain-containing protein 2B isoform X2 n=1 Tax=Rhinatrema bivittatum TaxID=194408 RepID=UPI001126675D|nr:GRAM domain-containing protein 2B isoform X2 [Rhinatrema bivittatum]